MEGMIDFLPLSSLFTVQMIILFHPQENLRGALLPRKLYQDTLFIAIA